MEFPLLTFSSRKDIHRSLYPIFLLLVIVCIPFHLRWASGWLILFSLNWLIEGNLKAKLDRLRERPLFLLFSGLYLIYMISIIWSANKPAAWFDMEVKLSLFWLPIIFGSMSTEAIGQLKKKTVLIVFALASAAAGLYCLVNAIYNFWISGNSDLLYYGYFSAIMHATYFAAYLNFALIIAAYYLITEWRTSLKLEKMIYSFVILMSLISVYFLNSRTGYLIFLVSSAFMAVMLFRGSLLSSRVIAPLLLVVTIFFAAIWLTPSINKRISAIGEEFSHLNSMPEKITEYGAIRIPIWKIAIAKIKQRPWIGYGNGDVTDTLVSEYERYGYMNIVKDRYNAHNQFLQTMLAAGMFALLLLCLTLALPFIQAIRNGDVIYTCFLLIILLLFIIDTGLKVQAGLIFYALFNAFLLRKSVKSIAEEI